MGLACMILGHQPNVYRRWMDEAGWRTRCLRCRTHMRMDHVSGRWPRWSTGLELSDR